MIRYFFLLQYRSGIDKINMYKERIPNYLYILTLMNSFPD
jgi:hypothetical protein